MGMPLTPEIIRELCEVAVATAKKSVREDEREHPLVGALLADSDGNILATSFRGETPKRHAKFCLLEKVASQGIEPSKCTLFVTLEPCIKRDPEKVPCAIRVAEAGIKTVYIGTLDPDPRITGRGEMYLIYEGIAVEHFPGDIAEDLRSSNKPFFDRFRGAHFWDPPLPSLYGADGPQTAGKPRGAGDREGMLYQTLDLITASSGPVWISAGDVSWLRELQVALIGAALDGREMRLLQHSAANVPNIASIATHLGLSLAYRSEVPRPRFAIVGPRTAVAAAIIVEKPRALLFRMPDEESLLDVVTDWFDKIWTGLDVIQAKPVQVRELSPETVISALRTHVKQYERLRVRLEEVDLSALRPATSTLESFKLFRIHQLAALRARHNLPDFAYVDGSPWPLISPPIVERLPDGSLVIIDGTHRSYSARARGETTIRALVIDNPNFDLPSQPARGWSNIEILSDKLPRERRYAKFDSSLFRPIRAAYESLSVDESGETAR